MQRYPKTQEELPGYAATKVPLRGSVSQGLASPITSIG
jgi:hypothetical protein